MGLDLDYTFQNGTPADADQVNANFQRVQDFANGGIDITSVLVGTPVAQDSQGGLSQGSGPGLAAADHKHILRGWERLAADPTSQNFIGRTYWNTTNNNERKCIALGSPDSWITTGNMAASDLPNHASRHATGGPDALPTNSVDQGMLTRTAVGADLSADVSLSSGSWTDLITGIQPVIVGTQQNATLFLQVGASNGSNTKNQTIAFRVIDQNNAVYFQSKGEMLAHGNPANPGSAVSHVYTWPVQLVPGLTLKMQGFADDTTVTVSKSATLGGGSAFACTRFAVLVG